MWLFLWFGHLHVIIQDILILKKTMHPVQWIYRNINSQNFTKLTNCGGNCITRTVARVWRMWRGKALIFRRFCVQEHVTYTTIPFSALLWNFHLQNTFYCTCVRYSLMLFAVFFSLMFWVSHLINQSTATTFCIIKKYFLFRKILKLDPSKHVHTSAYQLMHQCCPPLSRYPHTIPVLILLSSVSICMNETGKYTDWLLRNVAVRLIIECTALI